MKKDITIMIPTNRKLAESLPAISRPLGLLRESFSMVISDNSEDLYKRSILTALKNQYDFDLDFFDPDEGAIENFRNCIRKTQTDYCMFLGDDDDFLAESVKTFPEIIKNNSDPLTLGFTGLHYVANPFQRFFHNYKPLSSASSLVRTNNLLNSGPTNFLFYSIWKRDVLLDCFDLLRNLPLTFPFRDWLLSFYFILRGKVIQKNYPLYQYNTLNWIRGGGNGIMRNAYKEMGFPESYSELSSLMLAIEGYWVALTIAPKFDDERSVQAYKSGLLWIKWWSLAYLKRKKHALPKSISTSIAALVQSKVHESDTIARVMIDQVFDFISSDGGEPMSSYCSYFRSSI